jgi:hypothetical protein
MRMIAHRSALSLCLAALALYAASCKRQQLSAPVAVPFTVSLDATKPDLSVVEAKTTRQNVRFSFPLKTIEGVTYVGASLRGDDGLAIEVLAARVPGSPDAVHVVANATDRVEVRVQFRARDGSDENVDVARALGSGHHDFTICASDAIPPGAGGRQH